MINFSENNPGAATAPGRAQSGAPANNRQIILDTETTGLSTKDGHRIIEIGCVELINRRFSGNTLHMYFNPEREIDAGALSVHGISQEFLSDKPRFCDKVDEIMRFLNDAELIIHNAAFDIGFLNYELQLLNHPVWREILDHCRVLDTLLLARQYHPGQRNSLDALCKRYDINNSHRQLHGALLDAEILGQVYLAMTGGQTTLALTEEAGQPDPTALAAPAMPLRPHLSGFKVVSASAEELIAHKEYLKMLSKASGGQTVWNKLEINTV